jgi:hypothetical protein
MATLLIAVTGAASAGGAGAALFKRYRGREPACEARGTSEARGASEDPNTGRRDRTA